MSVVREGGGRARGRRRLAAAGLAAGLAAAVVGAGAAGAYGLLGSSWRYVASPMGESLQVCVTGGPPGAAAAIKQAAARWNYGRFSFVFQADGCSSGGRFPTLNGVNQIDFGPLGTGTLGQTTTYYNTSNRGTTECDLRLNSRTGWYVGTGTVPAGRFDLLTIALHEFGHCLGLGHSTGPGWPVMYPSYRTGQWNRVPTADDVAGRNAIYGQ